MKNFKEIKPVLAECIAAAIKSPYATDSEKNQMELALQAGEWEGGIDFMANEILGRRVHATGTDEVAEFVIDNDDGKELIITVTSGRNQSKKFLVQRVRKMFKRGDRKFSTLAAVAGSFCA